jgi:DNA-directed RNA polymerase specialized sigma24 family protein
MPNDNRALPWADITSLARASEERAVYLLQALLLDEEACRLRIGWLREAARQARDCFPDLTPHPRPAFLVRVLNAVSEPGIVAAWKERKVSWPELEALTRAPRALYEAHCRLLGSTPEPWPGEEEDMVTELGNLLVEEAAPKERSPAAGGTPVGLSALPGGVALSSLGSITVFLTQLQQGERDIVQQLWERYFHRLIGLARKKLVGLPLGVADPEDVALSALDSFCRGAELGRFARLADRHDLWQILVFITARKASDLRQYEQRDKRDWRRVERAAGRGGANSGLEGSDLARVLSREPDPAFAAEVAEECRRLLDALPDEELRQIAVWKMEGCTNEEIAARQDCSLARIERKLARIRAHWAKESPTAEETGSQEDDR